MQKTSYSRLLEIACFNLESCILAQEAGADRVEFCTNYSVGGLTPNITDIIKAKGSLNIPLHVIIRPRGGNFIYNEEELTQMKEDILLCKACDVDGVVFGVLNDDHKIDKEANKLLLDLAGNMSTTFHRAIDSCEDIVESMNNLIDLGFTRVLTSGGKANAKEGAYILKELQQKFGSKIIIIPGGGIRSNNIVSLISETGCFEYHSAALLADNEMVNTGEIQQLLKCVRTV